MNSTSKLADDHDIEMGSIGITTPVAPQKSETSCYGKIFTDWSLNLAVVVDVASAVGAGYSYYLTNYVAAGIFSGIFVLNSIVSPRLHCLGKLKDQNTQNQKLGNNINKLTQEKLNIEKENDELKEKMNAVDAEENKFKADNAALNASLNDKIKEIKKLNITLQNTEKKIGELEPITLQFKALEDLFNKQTANLLSNEKDLQKFIDTSHHQQVEDNKFNDIINSETKNFDGENKEFAQRLKDYHQLVQNTQQQIQNIKQANDDLRKTVDQYKEKEEQNKDYIEKLSKAELKLHEINLKFTTFIENLKILSEQLPQLKPIIESVKLS